MSEPLPVTILTGFLGSGKTTLLNRLLQHPAMQDTVVIVNEVGEIALDHLLVESALEDTIVLQSGCICCSIRGDLVDTLMDLTGKQARGEIPPFARVVIETTGLADPAPILRTLIVDPLLKPLFRLRRVVTTVDAVLGLQQLARQPEAVKQAALADFIVITKSELASSESLGNLQDRLVTLNPLAQLSVVSMGEIDPDVIFGDPAADATLQMNRLAAHMFPGRRHAGGDSSFTARHGIGIRACAMGFDRPFPAAGLRMWLGSLLSLRSADVLRIKGLFEIEGEARPVVVHAVQHMIHPFGRLETWPLGERRSSVVCITRDIPDAALRYSLDVLLRA